MQTNTEIQVKEKKCQIKVEGTGVGLKEQNSVNGEKKVEVSTTLPLPQVQNVDKKSQEIKIQKEGQVQKLQDKQQNKQVEQVAQQQQSNQEISNAIVIDIIQEVVGQDVQGGEENEDNWTDATESIAADDDDDIWVVDDDIIAAMEIDSQEEGEEGQEKMEGDEEDDEQDDEDEEQEKKDEVNLEELQNQFIKGGQSDEDWRLGLHQKFCTSVGVFPDGKTVVTGGGDDTMLCFRESNGVWQQFYRLKHGETVSKVQVSHDGKYVVSLSEKQIYCTDISKLQSKKLEVEEPVDVVCHKQGGVLAAAYGFTIAIHNLKGLDLFANFHLDLPPSSIAFSDNGKQIIAACENKLRFITPKTGEIVKVAGNQFHKEQISTVAIQNTLVATGCIEGKVFLSNLTKGNILGGFDVFKGSINCLSFADNYLLVAPQGDGVYWTDPNKLKTLFHSPAEASVSAIVNVHSPNHFAIGDLEGGIHFVDRRAPKTIITKRIAGNSIHALQSKGSLVFAACEDGYVRVFDIAKMQ